MQYYTFELNNDESKDLTTIVALFGKYRYNVSPMGLKCSPDFTQETMKHIFHGIEDAEVCTSTTLVHSQTLGTNT